MGCVEVFVTGRSFLLCVRAWEGGEVSSSSSCFPVFGVFLVFRGFSGVLITVEIWGDRLHGVSF